MLGGGCWGPLIAAALVLAGCAPGAASIGGQDQATPRETRTLQSVIRVEPVSLAVKPLQSTGISIRHATRLFNAELNINDSRENPRPYLAEALPQLNTDSWRVFPDGRMETSYRLKPNLVWHDGVPLSAEDFVFAARVYSTAELGVSLLGGRVEEVLAPDDRTLILRWRVLYPDAGTIGTGLPPLPRHILAEPFSQALTQPQGFVGHPFWSTQYVGLGPYRLDRWEPGSSVEGVAFDRHVWGRPQIDRVAIRFMSDENTVMATLLAEGAHLSTDRSIRFQHGMTLRREWRARNGGTVILTPSQGRYTLVQFRPEVVNPQAMLDLRVRRALAHAIDKQTLNDAVFEGQGLTSNTLVRPDLPYFAEIDRAITKYPYDARQAQQLMEEAGFHRGPDGFFAGPAGERFAPVLWDETGAQNEQVLSVMVDTWRRAALDVQGYLLPAAQLPDAQVRTSFPAMYTTTGGGVTEGRLGFLAGESIPRPENRWSGQNRGGWSNSEYDRFTELFTTTLDRTARNGHVVQMERLISEHLPALMLFFNFGVSAHLAALRGPDPNAIDSAVNWNVHEWELR